MTNGMLRQCHSNAACSILCHTPHACSNDKRLVNHCIFVYFLNFQMYYLKMEDYPDFSIHFVGIIENNSRIYKHIILDYNNKNVIDSSWRKCCE